jgi:hypothetical protein
MIVLFFLLCVSLHDFVCFNSVSFPVLMKECLKVLANLCSIPNWGKEDDRCFSVSGLWIVLHRQLCGGISHASPGRSTLKQIIILMLWISNRRTHPSILHQCNAGVCCAQIDSNRWWRHLDERKAGECSRLVETNWLEQLYDYILNQSQGP